MQFLFNLLVNSFVAYIAYTIGKNTAFSEFAGAWLDGYKADAAKVPFDACPYKHDVFRSFWWQYGHEAHRNWGLAFGINRSPKHL